MVLADSAVPVLAVVVVSLLSFGSLRLYSWRTAAAPPKTAMRRIRLALGVGLVLTGVLALFALLLADALDVTESGLRALSPTLADSVVGSVLTWVPTMLGVTIAVVVGYLGAFPYVREIRELDVSAVRAAGQMAKLVVVFFALVVAAVGSLSLLPVEELDGALSLAGFLVAVTVALLAVQPRIVAVLNTVREPTDAERDRIDRFCETAGISPHRVRVLDLGANRVATVMVAGVPGRRHLLVTDDLLADLGDDAAAAVVANKTGRAKRYYRETKFGVLLVVGTAVLGVVSGELPAATGLDAGSLTLVVAALGVALLSLGKRLVFAADDYAVERVGAETYVETLEALADDYQVSYESGRLRSLVLMRPSLGTRLDRLWGRVGD